MGRLAHKTFSFLIVLVVPFLVYFSYCYWDNSSCSDLLNCVFEPSEQYDTIIDFWNTKSDVWHTVLRESTEFELLSWFSTKAPLIVRIVKIILKMTIVLSVTMVIYYGVKFMLQVFKWDDLKSASAKKDLINLFIWLWISLFSVTAVTLVISIPKSSLTTWEDLSSFEVWCRIGANLYTWNTIKGYLCTGATLWYDDNPAERKWEFIEKRTYDSQSMDNPSISSYRCKVIQDTGDNNSWKWIRIKNKEVKKWCDELGWEFVDW